MKTRFFTYVLLAAYIVAVLSFFMYYLFPSDKAKQYVKFNVSRIFSDLNITISQIKPAFPKNINFTQTNIFYANKPLFEIDKLSVTPKLSSIFDSVLTLYFQANMLQGVLDGKVDLEQKSISPRIRIDAKLFGISIKDNKGLKDLFKRNISGTIDGDVNLIINKSQFEGLRAKLDIKDCAIEMLNPVLGVEVVKFKNIQSEMLMDAGKIRIKECSFKGNQLDGHIIGSISLRNPLGKSQIQLKGRFNPHPQLLKRLGKEFLSNLLSQKIHQGKGFPIRISGTIENSIVEFNI